MADKAEAFVERALRDPKNEALYIEAQFWLTHAERMAEMSATRRIELHLILVGHFSPSLQIPGQPPAPRVTAVKPEPILEPVIISEPSPAPGRSDQEEAPVILPFGTRAA